MTTGIRSDTSGTFGALTFGGDDAVTFDATGIQAGSYKPGSIVAADLTLSANSAPVKVALNAAGGAPIFACRAWVNFNGTGTVGIRASGNVSSITDNSTGNYTVNFTTEMPDANYIFVAPTVGTAASAYNWCVIDNENNASQVKTATSHRVKVVNSTSGQTVDAAYVYLAYFR